MKNNPEHIDSHTLLEFIKGEATKEEVRNILNWLNSNPENEQTLNQLKTIWNHSQSLSDLKGIDTNNDWGKVKSRINFESEYSFSKSKRTEINFPYILRIAASIAIFIGLAFLINNYLEQSPQVMISSTTSEQKEFFLSDGSRVYLNEYSELSFPEKFKNGSREVQLNGEALFEVSGNKNRPFIINTSNNGSIKVLGTIFNVEADKNSTAVIVHVLEGKVALYESANENNSIILASHEKGTLENQVVTKSTFEQQNFLSWKTGALTFENTTLEVVVGDLSDYYERPLILQDNEIAKYKLTTTINNQPLEEVLEEITLVLDLKYLIENDTIKISKPLSP